MKSAPLYTTETFDPMMNPAARNDSDEDMALQDGRGGFIIATGAEYQGADAVLLLRFESAELRVEWCKKALAAAQAKAPAPTVALPTPAAPDIVEGLIRPGEIVAIVGPAKSGKTRLACELARAVASGKPLLGVGPAAVQHRVIYVALDDAPGRLARLIAPDTAGFPGNVSATASVNVAVSLFCGAAEPVLVVLDSWAEYCRACSIEINDAHEVGGELRRLRSAVQKNGGALVILATSRLGDAPENAGSVAFIAGVDAVLRERLGPDGLLTVPGSWR